MEPDQTPTEIITILLRKPNSEELLPCQIDKNLYEDLIAQGWNLTINFSDHKTPYVIMNRRRNGQQERNALHRWILLADERRGHAEEVHHRNFNSLDNRIDNLRLLPQREHRRIHAARRQQLKRLAA